MNNIDLLRRAQRDGYAIPAFNYTDVWEFLAISEAAEEMDAPVYAASAAVTVNLLGLDICGALGNIGYARAGGALYNHLDHCQSPEVCEKAVEAGYHSVMYDGSALPLEENIANLKRVTACAAARNVFVEGEVGHILGRSDEGSAPEIKCAVTVRDCLRVARETGINSLAIGIGNQHGFYTASPHLNVDLLSEVSSLTDVPLVLHGSTGLSEEIVRDCIARGVCKVNVGTDVHNAYLRAACQALNDNPGAAAVAVFAKPAKEAMKKVISRWIRVCGAQGKRGNLV